jgi:hypothetical protein
VTRPTRDNYAGQPRDAHGRFTEEGAVRTSRAAHKRSEDLLTKRAWGAHAQGDAAKAHREAASQARALAKKHAELGNKRAARNFGAFADDHEESADYHQRRVDELDTEERAGRKPARAAVSARRSAAARLGHEHRSERDQEALANIEAIEPSYLPLWTKEQRRFKGSPHERYEQFVEYADSHPNEVARAYAEESERKTESLIRSYEGRSNPGDWEGMPKRRKKNPEGTAVETISPDALLDEGRTVALRLPDDDPRGAAFLQSRERAIADGASLADRLDALELAAALTGKRYEAGDVIGLQALTDEAIRRDAFDLSLGRTPPSAYSRGSELANGDPRISASLWVAIAKARVAEEEKDEPFVLVVLPPTRENPRPPTYTEAHWGLEPSKSEKMTVAEPGDNKKLIAWGELVAVTYGTRKGNDPRLVDYTHTFSRQRPMLCYGSKDGRLFIVGGDYTATERGIVG